LRQHLPEATMLPGQAPTRLQGCKSRRFRLPPPRLGGVARRGQRLTRVRVHLAVEAPQSEVKSSSRGPTRLSSSRRLAAAELERSGHRRGHQLPGLLGVRGGGGGGGPPPPPPPVAKREVANRRSPNRDRLSLVGLGWSAQLGAAGGALAVRRRRPARRNSGAASPSAWAALSLRLLARIVTDVAVAIAPAPA
jgi:hypothetical protein